MRLLCAWVFTACGAAKSGRSADAGPTARVDVPAWVDRVPAEKGKICALGSAEPTFFREDGKIYAAENARTQLAATLSLRVESVMVDIQSSHPGEDYVDQQYVTQAQTFATDAVVSGAQVVSYWFDETGARGRTRATYALGCIDTNLSITELNNRLRDAFPEHNEQNATVRERAHALFDDLEKQETKQADAKARGDQ